MSADLVISGYVRIAKQDLDGARLLNQATNRNAAYLCEQAAEKLIRAVLTSEGIQGGIRHELPDMVAKIADENPVKPLLRDRASRRVRDGLPISLAARTRQACTYHCRDRSGHHQDRRRARRDRGPFRDRSLEARWPCRQAGSDSLSRRDE